MPIIKSSIDPSRPLKMTASQKARFDAIKDEDIDYSDIPELGEEFFARAKQASMRKNEKTRITMRIDADILEWLKSFGAGYQTRANNILRAAMEYRE